MCVASDSWLSRHLRDRRIASDTLLASELLANSGYKPQYGNIDLSDDGVAFLDFLELANNFGKKPSDVAAVPEPGAMTLVLLGFLPILALRRKRSRSNSKPGT
jgi:hypothetical protein